MVMKGELGRIVALLGLSALLVSCAQILGEGGLFDDKGAGGGKTTSGETTAAGLGGAPGDTSVTTASNMTSGPSGPSGPTTTSGPSGTGGAPSTTSSSMTTTSGPTTTTTSSSSGGGGTGCPQNSTIKLADNFDDVAYSKSLWTNTLMTDAVFKNNALVLNGDIEVYSKQYYPIINCYAAVKVAGIGKSSGHAHLNINNSDATKTIQISTDTMSDGYITFEAPTGSMVVKNCLYDQSKHLYWRIRFTDTYVYLETAGEDGKWIDQPCDNGVARKALTDIGFGTSNVQVHMGVNGVTSSITFDDFDKP